MTAAPASVRMLVSSRPGVLRRVGLLVRRDGVRPDGDSRDVADVVVEQSPEVGGRGDDCGGADDELRRIRRGLQCGEEDGVAALRVAPVDGGGRRTGR
ncbi:MAG TPA: hypothetical protein VIG79_06580 [Lapillicoccus sp.]|uniref:hypothetical protein n=1 Tax=Lapillicoccus sp. TaxID=1909287 RepID=UPI002F936128